MKILSRLLVVHISLFTDLYVIQMRNLAASFLGSLIFAPYRKRERGGKMRDPGNEVGNFVGDRRVMYQTRKTVLITFPNNRKRVKNTAHSCLEF